LCFRDAFEDVLELWDGKINPRTNRYFQDAVRVQSRRVEEVSSVVRVLSDVNFLIFACACALFKSPLYPAS